MVYSGRVRSPRIAQKLPLGVCAGTLMGADMVGPPLQGPSGPDMAGPIKGLMLVAHQSTRCGWGPSRALYGWPHRGADVDGPPMGPLGGTHTQRHF